MEYFQVTPIAHVKGTRSKVSDDNWLSESCEIILADHIPDEALSNIELFSHLEIIFLFDKVNEQKVVYAGHPRENKAYPFMGIFAQRKKDRPNRIGLTTVELVSVTSRSIMVKGLDAIDGTPVLDIKPVMKEFQPKGEIKQPGWVSDLMKSYWQVNPEKLI
jgi:tRNA (adenine37-N6)-methyltransferase